MRILHILLFLAPAMLAAQLKDTVTTTPALPTTRDSIAFNLFNLNNCCCSQYYDQAVQLESGGKIYFSYKVDTSPCLLCFCLGTGSRTTFTGGPIPAGNYTVYKAESPYCPPAETCGVVRITPVLISDVTVIEDDTFKIELTGTQCFTLPCSYYRVIGTAGKETTLVAGVKIPDGSYQDPFTRNIVPWRDQGYPVLGYFTTDSLAGWMRRDTVFVIAQVVEWPAISVKDNPRPQRDGQSFALYPQPITLSAVIDVPRAGMVFKVYTADGKLVDSRTKTVGRQLLWDASNLENGVYFVSLEDGLGRQATKVIIRK